MHQKIITAISLLINMVRITLSPITLYILGPFIAPIRRRVAFERLNSSFEGSRSFSNDSVQAFIAFEVSSEGELEQIMPVLKSFIGKGKRVELIYSSESVERKCLVLYQKYGADLIRIYRLSLLTYGLQCLGGQRVTKWMTASRLVLCRYDFFPELFIYGLKKSVEFYVVSATLKNKSENLYNKLVYRCFDMIVAASEIDRERFISLGISKERLITFDFRVLQIVARKKMAMEVLNKIELFADLQKFFDLFNREERLILGSAWRVDLELFNNEDFKNRIHSGEICVAIAPHKLSQEFILECAERLEEIGVRSYHIRRDISLAEMDELMNGVRQRPGVLLISIPGILCELYNIFGHVYVGGGLGRSIHSVLEPYLADAVVYCGPRTHRSTEYDFIKNNSPQFAIIVKNLKEFYEDLKIAPCYKDDLEARKVIVEKMSKGFLDIIESIGREQDA